MRQRRTCLTLVIVALASSGCATMTVSSYVQHDLNFAQYQTYDWGPAETLSTGDPRLDNDPFFQDHMQGAVERQLASRGYVQVASGRRPDLLLRYHASIARRLDVSRTDREYGSCRGSTCLPRVTDFARGTLIVDVADARTNALIWRGWAQHALGNMRDGRDRMAARIEQAVSRMFATLPEGSALVTGPSMASMAGDRR